jgi:hypothetical protein
MVSTSSPTATKIHQQYQRVLLLLLRIHLVLKLCRQPLSCCLVVVESFAPSSIQRRSSCGRERSTTGTSNILPWQPHEEPARQRQTNPHGISSISATRSLSFRPHRAVTISSSTADEEDIISQPPIEDDTSMGMIEILKSRVVTSSGGILHRCQHKSSTLGGINMIFSIFLPKAAQVQQSFFTG